jgi:hypothetical protein
MEKGIHILDLIVPVGDYNSEANHGMLKDIQEKVLLFPLFDVVEVAKAALIDKENDIEIDTYEDLTNEIEELKNELQSIVVTQTSVLGKENFDTPAVKLEGSRKGHQRKDRYSALLYANYYARNRDKKDILKIEYKAVGGTKETLRKFSNGARSTQMYTGPGMIGFHGADSWLLKGGKVVSRD